MKRFERARRIRFADCDPVQLALEVERLGAHSLTLRLRCTGERGADDVRMSLRQVIATTSLATHEAIVIPTDLRDAVARFAHTVP